MRADDDSHPRPYPLPRPRDGEDPIVQSSIATRPALPEAIRRQYRAAMRQPQSGRVWRASQPVGAHVDKGLRAAARQARPRVGTSRLHGHDRHGCDRDEDRGRKVCRALVRALREPTGQVPARHAAGSGYGCHRMRLCAVHDCPTPLADRACRRAIVPTAPGARSSVCACRVTAAKRSAEPRWQACQDRPGNPRPQWDHLRANGACGMSTSARADRRMEVLASIVTRRVCVLADTQAARKSGLRRSHSHANPRASKVRRA